MVTVDDESVCLRCGKTIQIQTNCRSGETTQLTWCGCDKIEDRLRKKLKDTRKEIAKYRKGFDLLNEYFDSISDEEKPKVDKQLRRWRLY